MIEGVELMNKGNSLFKEINKVRRMEINPKTGKKFRTVEEKREYAWETGLMDRVLKANAANGKLFNYMNEMCMEAIKEGSISIGTYAHILQAQTSLKNGYRAITNLALIDFGVGSQAVYKYKNAKGETIYTDNSTRKVKGKTVEHEVNRNNPDLIEATRFYMKPTKTRPKGLSASEAEIEAIKNLTSKGEHLMPNANTMIELLKIALEYRNGKLSKDQLQHKLDMAFLTHSQLLTSKYKCDIIDRGGQNNPTGFHRIKFLNEFGFKGNKYIVSFFLNILYKT